MKFEIFPLPNLRQFIKLTIVAVLLYGTYCFLSEWNLGETVNPQRIVEYLDGWGPAEPIVFILMMATAVVISPIPSLPLDLAAGVAARPAPPTRKRCRRPYRLAGGNLLAQLVVRISVAYRAGWPAGCPGLRGAPRALRLFAGPGGGHL